MKRLVSVFEVLSSTQPIKVLVEDYSLTLPYPNSGILFDLNTNKIIPKVELESLSQIYISRFIYGVLGREGSLVGGYLAYEFNNSIPEYDLSIYELGTELNLEFDGYILVQNTELVDTKNQILEILNEASTVEEIKNEVKNIFNLTEIEDAEVEPSSLGKTPYSIRPKDLIGISELFGQYLYNSAYVKGNYVEFEVDNPYSDFKSGNQDTELMAQIRDYYSSWDGIELENVEFSSIKATEVYPIADPNMYIKTEQEFVNVLPEDIEIQLGGNFYKVFQAGPLTPRLVVSTESGHVDLTLDNIRVLSEDQVLISPANVRYRSAASGLIGTELYFKMTNGEYQPIENLSRSLAMFSRVAEPTSKTRFRFYFK